MSGCCRGHADLPTGRPAAADGVFPDTPCCNGVSRNVVTSITPDSPASGGSALLDMLPGQTATVRGTSMDSKDARLLRAMGLRPNCVVRMCRVGEPCIVEVMFGCAEGGKCSCRIGLSRPLAERVLVGDITK